MRLLTCITHCLLVLISSMPVCFGMQNAFYVLHGKQGTQEALTLLKTQQNTIDILITQAYHFNQRGIVTGYINPDLLNFSHRNGIKLMAMVTNSLFDGTVAHRFLSTPTAQQKMLATLLQYCKEQKLYGIQFDLEMVRLKDKALLTQFYQKAATLFHQNGFVVSFAVAPIVSHATTLSAYQKRMYKVWGGAYDLAALGKAADFVTVMTYDQHLGLVTPGPTAGIRWVEEVIKNTLKDIPAHKISLGVPSYSHFWYTGQNIDNPRVRLQCDAISYAVVQKILKKRDAHLQWDPLDKVHYASYAHNWLNEYLFVEDAESLKTKLALVNKYHLRGISLFRIGTEDPRIWPILKSHPMF